MNDQKNSGITPEEAALANELPRAAEVWPSRREFIGQVSGCAVGALALPSLEAQLLGQAAIAPAPAQSGAGTTMKVAFTVNGKPRELELDTRTTLLDALREHLHLTGSK